MSEGPSLPLAEVVAAVARDVRAATGAGDAVTEVEIDLAVEVHRTASGTVEVGVLAGGPVRGLVPARHRVVLRVRPGAGAAAVAAVEEPTAGVTVAGPVADAAAPADGPGDTEDVVVAVAKVDTPQQAAALASALRHGTAPARRWATVGVARFAPATATLVDAGALAEGYRAAGGGALVVLAAALTAGMGDTLALDRAAAVVEALGGTAAFDVRGGVAGLSAPPPAVGDAHLLLVTR